MRVGSGAVSPEGLFEGRAQEALGAPGSTPAFCLPEAEEPLRGGIAFELPKEEEELTWQEMVSSWKWEGGEGHVRKCRRWGS